MLAFTAGKSHVGAYVSVRDRRTGCGGRWMCFSAEDDKHSQGSGLGSPPCVWCMLSTQGFFVLFFKVVRGNSWRACSSLGNSEGVG